MIVSIITIISPLLGLLIICLDVVKKWNKEIEPYKVKKLIFPLAFICGAIGYSMRFNMQNDLTRYFSQLIEFTNVPFKEIIINDLDGLFTRDALFFYVAKTNNEYILSFLVGFLSYFVVFYILFDMIRNSEIKFKGYEIIFMSVLCVGFVPLVNIITNVRCVLAYLIMSLGVYRNCVKNKFDVLTIILYIIPLGLHSSAIILLAIRIISILLKKFSKISIIIAISLPTLINFTHDFANRINFGFIGLMLKNAINKAYYYLYWNEGGWASQIESSISNYFTRITGTIMICSIILMLFFLNNNDKEKNKKIQYLELPMVNYLYYVSVFALGCLTIKTGAFWRFSAVIIMLSPVVFIQMIEKNNILRKKMKYMYIFGIAVSLVNIIYQIRNVNFIQTTINVITTSGFEILLYIIKGLIRIIV